MFDSQGNPVFSSAQVGALRIFFASTVLLPVSLKLFRQVKDLKTWGLLFLSGICGNFIPAFLFTFAEREIDSGYAGMLNSFTPIFTLLLGLLAFGTKIKRNEVFGVIIGAIGAIILGTQSGSSSTEGKTIYILAIVLATALYGLNVNLIKKYLSHLPAQVITASVFFTLWIPSIIAVLWSKTPTTLFTHPHAWRSIGFVAILGVAGTALTTLFYNRVIAKSSAVFASTVTLLIPLVAMFIGIASGEHLNTMQILGISITLIGIIFITVFPSIRKEKTRSENAETTVH